MKLETITQSIFDGKHGDCKNKNGSGCYFISVKDLREYDIDYSNAREIDESDFSQAYARTNLESGDTIYANTGDTIGKSIFVVENELIKRTAFQKSLAVIKPNVEFVEPRYLYYLLKYETPRLRKAATGSGQKNLLLSTMRDFSVDIIERGKQKKLVDVLGGIDDKIRINNAINDNLAQMLRLLYEQWFYRFEFPNEQNLPYNRANGELEWNDKLKRRIPKGWKVQTMLSNELFSVISSGVDRFSTKKYYATADIIGSSIGDGSDIEYETRESRANMQPVINSVWFAKMKNSIKHLFLNKEMSSFVDNSILSTGFYGLKCNEISFEYIASVVSAPIFEITKDRLSHGATQQGIGDDDMANITLLIPDDTTLRKYHEATKGFFAKISNNILENKRLIAIRNFLLPLLMNGQATIAE